MLFRFTVKHNESDVFFRLNFRCCFLFLFSRLFYLVDGDRLFRARTHTNRIKAKKTKRTKRNRFFFIQISIRENSILYMIIFFAFFVATANANRDRYTRAHTQSQRSRRTAWRFNCCARIANTLLSSDDIALTAVWDVFVDVRTPIERRLFEIFIFGKNILLFSTHLHLKCHT